MNKCENYCKHEMSYKNAILSVLTEIDIHNSKCEKTNVMSWDRTFKIKRNKIKSQQQKVESNYSKDKAMELKKVK